MLFRSFEPAACINLKSPECNEAFIHAAGSNCKDIIELLIKNGVNINCKNISGLTALMQIALYGERIELMKFLIKNGADVNLGHSQGGLTSLMIAAGNNHTSEIKLLVDNGADINAQTTKGINALDIAIEMKKTDAIEILKKIGAITSNETNIEKLPIKKSAIEKFEIDSQADKLMRAAFNVNYKTVEVLFKTPMRRNVDSFGRAAIIYAIAGGNYETIKLLARENTDSGWERDSNYMTPIFYAVIYNNVKAAKRFIKLAGLNHIRGDGISPLKLAIELGRSEIIKLFKNYEITKSYHFHDFIASSAKELEIPIQLNTYDLLMNAIKKDDFEKIKKCISCSEGSDTISVYTQALIYASNAGDIEAVDHLIKNGANVNTCYEGYEKTSLLMGVCKNNNYSMAKHLIEIGADMYYEDFKNRDAMYKLIFDLNFEFIDLFIEKGFNVNKIYKNGQTLLMIICRFLKKDSWHNSEFMKVIRILLINHADTNIKNGGPSDGETALIMAMENENNELAKLLIEFGADVNIADAAGVTPLMIASGKGNLDGVKILIDNNAQVNVCDADGETAMFGAIENGYNDIIKYLIKNNAKLDITNQNGQTLLKTAIKFKNFEALELLK